MSHPQTTLAADLTPQQQQTWQRLLAFSFDANSVQKSFSSRLAVENGWTPEFTDRVLNEYRRFLFLTMVAGHPVCPSEEVDAAWHLHLIYSRSYWDDLCRNILGHPLHHQPTEGGPEESRKHWDMYRQTLASYRRIFGEEPPAAIWPMALDRFDPQSQPRTVNLRDHWIIRKPRWWPARIRRKAALMSGIFPLAIGLGPLDLPGPEFLLLYFCLFVIFYVGSIVYVRIRRDLPVDHDGDLTTDEIACLNFGRPAVVNATVARMLHANELRSIAVKSWFGSTVGSQVRFSPGTNVPAKTQPLPLAIYRAVEAKPLTPMTLQELQTAVEAETETIERSLEGYGYLLDKNQKNDLRVPPFCVMIALLALGIAKIAVGIGRDRPVAFLFIGCIVTFILFAATFSRFRRTLAGDRMVQLLKARYDDLRTKLDFVGCTTEKVALSAAIFGIAALEHPMFEDFKTAWKTTAKYGGGYSGSGVGCSGGGGGCGGGGCGGGGCGGGGCGGCGGG